MNHTLLIPVHDLTRVSPHTSRCRLFKYDVFPREVDGAAVLSLGIIEPRGSVGHGGTIIFGNRITG